MAYERVSIRSVEQIRNLGDASHPWLQATILIFDHRFDDKHISVIANLGFWLNTRYRRFPCFTWISIDSNENFLSKLYVRDVTIGRATSTINVSNGQLRKEFALL